MDRFIGKSVPKESIREHTDKLFEVLNDLVDMYGDAFSETELEIIRFAVEYHDYGKANYAFQDKLHKTLGLDLLRDEILDAYYSTNVEIPHGYLSSAFLPIDRLVEQYEESWVWAVINAIYYHHTRNNFTDGEIARVLSKDMIPRLGKDFAINRKYLSQIMKPQKPVDQEKWERYAILKGTLNRLDYAASSTEKIPIELSPLHKGLSLGQVVENIVISRFHALRKVQLYMKENTDSNLVIVASTGIGKTEAACIWAGDRKLFYTLPLKISINAIYKRLTMPPDEEQPNKGGYGYKNCTLLHSDALSYLIREEDDDEPFIKYRRARFFSYPVTICTVDQIFTFVERYLGCEIIPAVLKYSRVVIDEIQAYSPDIAARIIYGLKIVSEMGGKFLVMTATMPPVLEYFMKELGISYKRPEPFFSQLDSRHFIVYSKCDFDYEYIAEQGETKKVLVICNTVHRACEVYNKLRDGRICRLLHSRFQKRHRDYLEKAIMDFSNSENDHGIWITTQIVEASLDIDFDQLYTEMCPADSLLQRLGRCYRKRNYHGNIPNVFIHDTRNGVGTVYGDRLIYERSVTLLQGYCGRIFTELEKYEYVEKVYSVDELKGSDYFKQLVNKINTLKNLPPTAVTKKEAIQKFRGIISTPVIDEETFCRLNESGRLDELLSILRTGNPRERQLGYDELMSYTVSINQNYIKIKPDKRPINPLTEIYRIEARYDFDGESGAGLLDELYLNNIQ